MTLTSETIDGPSIIIGLLTQLIDNDGRTDMNPVGPAQLLSPKPIIGQLKATQTVEPQTQTDPDGY